jgi:hypothetical protein
MQCYHRELFTPLKEKLFNCVNDMILEDRNCDVVQRYKIKHLLRIFEEVDMKNPDLNKEGENLFWTGEPTHVVLNEWFNQHFVAVVSFLNLLISIFLLK